MRKFVRFFAVVLALPAFCAVADAYPSKPIRIIVPFPGGTTTDSLSRILGQSVSSAFGQPVVVENKAGADGAIGATGVAHSAPDGYTLLIGTNSPMSVVPAMKKSPYDPVADFTPITDIGRYTFFLYVNAEVPAKSFQELIAYAKANPGKLNYATGNTTGIVSFAQMNAFAGVEMVHVPYKGEPQGITDLVGGRVHLMWATPATGLPHVKGGKLRALVTQLSKRSALLPEVPTIAEAGMPQFTIVSWAGLFGPAKMPRDIVGRLNGEFAAAMNRPDVQAQIDRLGFALNPSTPEQLGVLVKEQMDSYRRILRAAGVQPE